MKYISLHTRFATEEETLARFLKSKQSEQIWEIVSHESGADREQWMIRFEQQLFIIFVEWLSESAWLEPVQNQGVIHLSKLSEIFT